uniref:G-protein coupled receptors family 1 profile domain-containing protein n=1 Tax=Ditylenchus dipsaci TaxID=166011 RepID=A0A915ENF5_9BILA
MTALSKISSWNSHNDLLNWISRKAETCLTSVYKFRNILTAFVYFLTIFFFLITVVMVRRARKASNFIHQMANNRRSVKAARRYFRFKLIKMTLNVATLAIFHLPYTIWALLLILSNDPCFYTNNYSQMQILMGIVRICLLLRITLDAIVQFATDRRIRSALWALLRIKHENLALAQSTCPTPKLSTSLRSVRSMAFIYAKKDATSSLRSVKSQGFLTVDRKDNGNGSCIQLEVTAQENGEVRLLLPK